MKLLVQPDDGVQPILKAIASAKKSIELVIFRFEQREIERALATAAAKGVDVRALIAHTNRAGEDSLRALEMRLLAAGITVARSADDLARYHGKMFLIDRSVLFLLAFNPTYNDIEHSRSFGVVIRKAALVREAARLFEADSKRVPYQPASDELVVSPVNARARLTEFIEGAKAELLIYDPKVSDRAMVRLLKARAAAGVNIRIIGRVTGNIPGVKVHKLSQMRLHTRTMIRDGKSAFIGSQSLRAVELDARRELGIVLREAKVVAALRNTFDGDWDLAEQAGEASEAKLPAGKIAKRVAKLVAKDIPQVAPVLDNAVKEIVEAADVELDRDEVVAALKGAVKTAVKEAVASMVAEKVDREESPRR